MRTSDWLQLALFVGALALVTKPLGLYLVQVLDASGKTWFDPVLKNIQEKVDGLLPNTNNIIDCGECLNPGSVLVSASSDRQPPGFYLYDTKAGTLAVLAKYARNPG